MYAKMYIFNITGDRLMNFNILHNFDKNNKMENLIVIPENEKQLSLVKELLQKMKIKYKIEKSGKQEGKDVLALKIQKAREEMEKGELVTVDPHHLWESI